MSKKRKHHNSQTGYSVYTDNSVSSIAPYQANYDLVNPDFRIPGEFPTPDFVPARRVTGGTCLLDAVYTPIAFTTLATGNITSQTFGNSRRFWFQETSYDPDLVSYSFNGSGVCGFNLSGNGEYATAAECIAANPTPVEHWAWLGASGFANQTLQLGNGPNPPNNTWNTTVAEEGAASSINIQQANYYIKDFSGDKEFGGNSQVQQGQGIFPGSTHPFRAIIQTLGTTHPTDGFDLDRFAWYRVLEDGGPTVTDYQFFLSDYINGVGGGGTGSGTGPGAVTWTETGQGVFAQVIAPTEWNDISTATVRRFQTDILYTASDTDMLGGNIFGVGILFDDVVEDGVVFRQILEGQCSISISNEIRRPTHSTEPSRNSDRQVGVYLHDPHLGSIGLYPSDDFVGAFGGQNSKTYYIPTRDQKVYIYQKYGKIRDPNITFNEREWARIKVSELDWSSGSPVTTVNIYSNPTLPPVPPELADETFNVLAEKTHSYAEQVISDVCVRSSSRLGWNIGTPQNLCYDSDELLDDGDPNTNRSYKYSITEVGYFVDCNGKFVEFKSPGISFSSSASCNPKLN